MIMDYEKAYKEALERAKKVHKYSSDIAEIKRMEDIFPELKESEDEKIRKAQLDYWRSVGGKEWHGVPVQETIAWLEKQGEKEKSPFNKQRLMEVAQPETFEEQVEHWQRMGKIAESEWFKKTHENMSVLDELEMTLSVSEDDYLRSNLEKLIKELKKEKQQ